MDATRRQLLKGVAATATGGTLAAYSPPRLTEMGSMAWITRTMIGCTPEARAQAMLSPVGQSFLPYPAPPIPLPPLPPSATPVLDAQGVCPSPGSGVTFLHLRVAGVANPLAAFILQIDAGDGTPFGLGVTINPNQPSVSVLVRVSDFPSGVAPLATASSFTFPPGRPFTVQFRYAAGPLAGTTVGQTEVTLARC